MSGSTPSRPSRPEAFQDLTSGMWHREARGRPCVIDMHGQCSRRYRPSGVLHSTQALDEVIDGVGIARHEDKAPRLRWTLTLPRTFGVALVLIAFVVGATVAFAASTPSHSPTPTASAKVSATPSPHVSATTSPSSTGQHTTPAKPKAKPKPTPVALSSHVQWWVWSLLTAAIVVVAAAFAAWISRRALPTDHSGESTGSRTPAEASFEPAVGFPKGDSPGYRSAAVGRVSDAEAPASGDDSKETTTLSDDVPTTAVSATGTQPPAKRVPDRRNRNSSKKRR